VSDQTSVTPEQWQRIKELFGAALDYPPEERAHFLDLACHPAEEEIRKEVDALLAQHRESDSGFQSPTVLLGPRGKRDLAKPGQVVDHYTIIRELGRGGMATVYLAQDPRHRRQVALKVLYPELAYDTLGTERFLQEIEVVANLAHPHIVPLHDSGEAGGLPYFVMPFIEGESLRARLVRERHLPVGDAVRIVLEVADALSYAHDHGVVHRDIKPENILLSGGHALVTDFGIARALARAGPERLTEGSLLVGTPSYMSPEQGSGNREVDARSDVYALGCVLYEMLAGEPAYSGPTAQAILASALAEAPPPLNPVRADVPPELDAAIAKAMSVAARNRFASAADFAQALRLAVKEEPTAQAAPAIAWFVRRPLIAALAVAMALGLGASIAFRWWSVGDEPLGPKLLAVLPFENLGSEQDEYLADGIADEVRGRLSMVPGLEVIGRRSSLSYKQTTKSEQDIARELKVQYLLTGTVQGQVRSSGSWKIRVTPELLQLRSGRAPRTRWQQPFDVDTSLADVFQVYADIANEVAQVLDLAPTDSTRRALAGKTTRDPAAYQAYLKGEEAQRSGTSADPGQLRKAIVHYRQAVALDSIFAEAWVALSMASSHLYNNTAQTEAIRLEAFQAAERALGLAPNGPRGHQAMFVYYTQVESDPARALEEIERVRELAGGNTDLQASYLHGLAYVEKTQGNLDSARVHFQRAHELEPRVLAPLTNLAGVDLSLRRYAEARVAADLALALQPNDVGMVEAKAMAAVGEGDLAGARAVIATAPKDVKVEELVAWFARYWDMGWLLNDEQRTVLTHLRPDAFDEDRGDWGLAVAQAFWLKGDRGNARAYADSARMAFEEHLQREPDDPFFRLAYGLCLAYLGRKTDAIRHSRRAAALMPISKNAEDGPWVQDQLARLYLLVGEPEAALDQLEPLLRVPYWLSPGWLRVDPTFDALRNNPRFQRLVAGG
jgi:serine/threonine-protein kinase